MRRAFYGNLFALVQAWRVELTTHTYENPERLENLHKRKVDLPKTFQTISTLMVKFSLNRVPSRPPKNFTFTFNVLYIQVLPISIIDVALSSKYFITYKIFAHYRTIAESNPSIAEVHCLISHHVNPNLFLFRFSTHIIFPSDVSQYRIGLSNANSTFNCG